MMMTTGQPEFLPSTREIRDAIAEEIAMHGGVMSDAFDDGQRLFVRAVLVSDAEVQPGDTIRAGIAVRVTGREIAVHPYTYRQICTNGAIAAYALESRVVERAEQTDVFAPAYELALTWKNLREAIRACASKDAFETVVGEIRSASAAQADVALRSLSSLSRLPGHIARSVFRRIMQRFAAGGDTSAFGLMNAVTSVARDTQDVAARWDLEVLGGGIPAQVVREVAKAQVAAENRVISF
jgi:hypothetical protein